MNGILTKEDLMLFQPLSGNPRSQKRSDVIENTFKNKTLTELEAEKLRLQSSLDKMKHKTITIENDHYKNDEKERMKKIITLTYTKITFNTFMTCHKFRSRP